MKYKNTFLAAGILAALAGCGGGSDGETNVPPPGNSGDNPTNPSYEYVVNATYMSSCGYITPQTDAMVIRHGSDGSAVAVYKADANGDIAIDYEDVATYTMLNVGYWNGQHYPRIHTYVDVTADKLVDRRIISQDYVDDGTCDCDTVTLDISSVPVASPAANVVYSTTTARTIYEDRDLDDFVDVEVCRQNNEEWPAIALTLTNSEDDVPEDYYTALITNYTFDETLVVDNAVLSRKVPINVSNHNEDTNGNLRLAIRGRVDNIIYYADNISGYDPSELPTSVPMFEEPGEATTGIDVFNTEYQEFYDYGEEVNITFYTGAEVRLPSTHTATVDLPMMSYNLFAEQAMSFFTTENYDFSASGADSVEIGFSARNAEDNVAFFFTLVTPNKGSLDIIDTLDADNVDFALDFDFDMDEELSGSYMFIHTKDVISTDDYLESLGSDEMTAYGIVYFDF